MVYLFDIGKMGDDGFYKGLLSVIENPNILKVRTICVYLNIGYTILKRLGECYYITQI